MTQLHLLTPRGFRAGAASAGIKTTQALDVAVLVCQRPASAAAVFTTNKVVAAPVIIGRKHVSGGKLRGVVVNSGNANACTGHRGLDDAVAMCRLAAGYIGCDPRLVLPSSTGIIGHRLPMHKIRLGIARAFEYMGNSLEHALRFCEAIQTTDTRRKYAAAELKIGKDKLVIAGVCKGSGMISPNLHATMLAYLTTDADVPASVLKRLLQRAADVSFNAVTVDQHTSTNDTAVALASGLGPSVRSATDVRRFGDAMVEVCQSLAYQIASDGEGATKVVRIDIRGASSDRAAKAIARAIASSPLVKCAMHGNDPNWGRIVSAAGFAGVPFDPQKAVLKLQGATVFRRGQPVMFDAKAVSKSLAAAEVQIELACNLGKAAATCWSCDLSKEYVTINAEYHT